MPNSTLVKDLVGGTLDFWQTAPNGVTLSAKVGDIVKPVNPTTPKEPTTPEEWASLAAAVVQTVDGLVRPVIELANLTSNTTGAAAKIGGVVLKNVGFLAAMGGWLADTRKLTEDLNNPKYSDIEKENKYESWLLGSAGAVVSFIAFTTAGIATTPVVATLGIAAVTLSVASFYADKNPKTSFSADMWRQHQDYLSGIITSIAKKTTDTVAYLGQLNDRVVQQGVSDAYQMTKTFLQPYATSIQQEWHKASADPIVYLKTSATSAYTYVSQTLGDGTQYLAKVTKDLVDGKIDLVRLFTPQTEAGQEGEIVVTADRKGGKPTVTFSGAMAPLASSPGLSEALASALLDFVASGQDFGSGTDGVSPNTTSSLSAAKVSGTAGAAPRPVAFVGKDGKVTVGGIQTTAKWTDNKNGFVLQNDDNGVLYHGVVIDVGGVPQFVETLREYKSGQLTVDIEREPDGSVKNTALRLTSNSQMVTFTDAFSSLGGVLGYRLAGGDELSGVFYSAGLRTVGENLGEVLDAVVFGSPNAIGSNINVALADFDQELLRNLKSAGVGAISSFLTAELVNALGLHGFAGGLANSATSTYMSAIIQSLPGILSHTTKISDVLQGVNVGNVIGGFLGSYLASKVVSFDTIGGQIGSAVGAALAPIAVNALLMTAGLALTPIGVAVVAFVGFIVGGLIGSIFGGTPRSGADATWSESDQKFVVGNVWSKKGGSKDAARSLASAAAETFNSVIAATGGTLLNPTTVLAGNYGMRKNDYVYQTQSSKDQNYISFRVSSQQEDSFGRVIGYGVYQGLTDPDFQLAGGDVYVKRAIYNTFELGSVDATNFDTNVLLGNISTAQSYERYLANSTVINALVSAESDSVFAAETLINLARADELGLTRRHRSDWFGGFTFLLKEADANAANVDFGFDYDPASGQVSRLIGVGTYTLSDTIDIAGQTTIEATAAADTIDLRTAKLADQRGFTVNGHLNNDIAASGTDFTAKTAVATFAANSRRTTVSVTVANDGVAEATEAFLASLTNAPTMRIMGGDAVATVIDGTAALPTLMVGDSYAWEDDGFAVFRVSLSKAATTDVTLSLTLTDGRASGAGADFGSTSATNIQVSSDGVNWTNATSLTFTAGSHERFVRTAIVADNTLNPSYIPDGTEPQYLNVEGNERFTLSATVTAGATALANGTSIVTGTGTIVDGVGNEPLVWMDNVILDEASGLATFTLSRSRALAATATVDFATSDRRVLDIDIAATVDGGDGNDTIHASNLGDNIFGGAGNDTLYGGRLDDWLLGGDGDDVLDAGEADQSKLGGDGNYLNGGAGNDTLKGREGSDWLEGGDGVDVLTGAGGDDILTGGAGDGDSLKGGLGSDQYLLRRGDGLDIVEEDATGAPADTGSGDAITQRMAAIALWQSNPTAAGAIRPDWIGTSAGVQQDAVSGGEDAVVFGAGIDIGDVRLMRSGTDAAPGNDLIIQVMETVGSTETFTGTQLVIRDWFTNPFKRVEWLKFADGNEIRVGDIASFIVGGDGNDVLIGTNGNDFVYGGAGNDKLLLLAGDDIGNGGTGNDMVVGDDGRDLLIGGLGNDELVGGKGSDSITGDAGADDIYGGADRDILSGGRGDGDVVVGGAGDDTFRYSRGDGRDTIFDEFANYWDVVWTSAGQWNAAGGYSYNSTTGEVTGPGGVVIRKNVGTAEQPDLQWLGRYEFDDATGTLKIFNPPADAPTFVANSGTDTIEFAPGINIQDVILRKSADGRDLVLAVSDEDDDLANTSLAKDSVTIKDWYVAPGQIERLAFYQTGVLDITTSGTTLIAGTDAADGTSTAALQGTIGADWITGAAGDDVIAGDSGNDILAGNSGFDTLRGGAGDDVLYGGTGNDTLDGGAGKDVLVGGVGQDIASYASSSTAVRVQLTSTWANTGDALGDEYYGIEDITGTGGHDTLGGDGNQNEIVGGSGNDTLLGNSGDDTYVWNVGQGADTIIEGSFTVQEAVTTGGTLASGYVVAIWAATGSKNGNNFYWRLQIKGPDGSVVYDNSTYLYASATGVAQPLPSAYIQAGWLDGFARTNGQQVTRQLFDQSVNGGRDELEFGPNISLNDLTFIQSGNDLIIRFSGSIYNQVTIKNQLVSNSAVETLKFWDGLSVSLSSVLIASSSSQLVGTTGDDLVAGQTGVFDDNLAGGAGDDVLVGYAGNDILLGGAGDDVLEGGLGSDTLDGGLNSDGTTPAGDTVRYARSAAAVIVDLNLSTAQGGTAASDSFGDILTNIENVVGSALSDTITGDSFDNRLFGLGGNDTIRGGAGNDVILGDESNDTLYGDAGEDSLSGGDGTDNLYGGTEKDTLAGGDGADRLYGENGDDTLTGGFGGDILDGGDGNDVLSGEQDDDTLTGGIGDDILSGGTGNDILNGGGGNDRYVLARDSGADILTDTSGTNALQFDASVSYDKIWMTRVGNDLRVSVIGGDAAITVTGFFLGAGSKVKTIDTTSHSLFLDHPETLNLITAMTTATASPAVTPVAMPATVSPLLATYWHAGGKAVPTGPATPRQFTLAEDGNLAIDGNYGVIDHDQNVTTYSLKAGSGPALGTISGFNPTTGSLTYTANPDANGSDTFIVIATDEDGQSVELPMAITLTPVNDAPRAIGIQGGGSLAVQESAPGQVISAGTLIGQLIATDPDGDTITYSLSDTASGRFVISPDGKLSLGNPGAIDFELAQSHTVRVRATDGTGAWFEQDFAIAVQDGNEANALPPSYAFDVNENVPLGTDVGGVTATDIDSSGNFANQRYYFWDGTTASGTSSDGRYAINATTGQITVNAALNFEAGTPSKTYQVIARDNAGTTPYNQVQTTVTIGIQDINEANSLPASYPFKVNENVTIGTLVDSVAASDFDGSGTTGAQQRYYFWNGSAASATSSDGRYAINATTGQIVTNAALNFEAGTTSVTYQVIARDNAGGAGYFQTQSAVTIAVQDVNEANNIPTTYPFSVSENAPVGTPVDTVVASDIDTTGNFANQRYYFWDGTTASGTSSDGRYAINATTGQITVNAALNFEAGTPSKTYQVIARDNAGTTPYNQVQTAVTIGIQDINEANNLPASYSFKVNENVTIGAHVDSVAASDFDGSGTTGAQQRYYFWNGSAASATSSDGRYAINATTGQIVTNAALNFEAGTTSVTYQVIARDNAGGAGYFQTQSAVTIAVQDVNEANNIPTTYPFSVSENAPVGTPVDTVVASDIDTTGNFANQRYYFWDGTTASGTSSDGRYAINATTGQITVNAALNFEAGTPSKTYQVIARDNAGTTPYNQVQSAVTIAINDLNEAPVSLNWTPSVTSVVERDRVATGTSRPAIALGTISVTDPDTGGLPSATYTFTLSDSRFEIVSGILRLRQDASLDFEAGATVTVTVTGTDQTGTPFTITRAIAITVTDQDDIFEGTASADTILGQAGRDAISGFAGNDTLNGNGGNDSIDGGDGADTINGGDGNDTLLGQAGADIIYGGNGTDTIRGGAEDDRLFGEDGNDSLYGDDGSDGVRAAGADSWRGFSQVGISGGNGDDLLDGGNGDDFLDGGAGADQLIGGAGFDGVDYSGSTAGVTVNLATGAGSGGFAQGDTLSSIELVNGSAYGDTITGSAGSDVVYGGAGNDVISGGAGNDYLFGGDGNDTINAEAGDDLLDGGAGDDTLNGGIDNDVYIVTRSSGADIINNYDPSGDDIDVIGFNDVAGSITDQDLWFERMGNDLKITVVATGSSVNVTNWYLVTDAASRANHKIDFIIASTSYSRTLNIEGLVTLMAGKTKPTTTAQRDTLMTDLTYKAQWATYWNTNAAPVLTAIAQQATSEDAAKALSVTATDDITPNAQVQLSAQVISGTNVVTNTGIAFGAANASGVRTMTINPLVNASGTARIRVTATDAGGITSSQEFDILVSGVADTPTITQFSSAGGTSGYPTGIPLNLAASFPDTDGSELQEVWITGVPTGISLSAGTYDPLSATWKLTLAQLSGLKLLAPTGWSSDVTLSATGRATENGQTAVSAAILATVSINAAPTNASFSGSVNENAGNGAAAGTVVGVDPDGDALAFSMVDGAGGRFVISSAGVVSVGNTALIDFETTTSHSITVRITDPRGEYIDRSFTIAVNNVNEANSLPAVYSFGVDENVAIGKAVGSVTASDFDNSATAFGQQRYYFWNGSSASATSSDGRYAINATTGQITVNAALSYEVASPSATYTVIARDNAGGAGYFQAQTSVTIGINNLNEANSLPASYSFGVDELRGLGTGVGTVTAGDLDVGGAFADQRYYFWDGTNASALSWDGRYQINVMSGEITTNQVLDYEGVSPSRAYTVLARDNAGSAGYTQSSTTVTIGITNVNERPYNLIIEAENLFSETVGVDTPHFVHKNIARFTMADPDGVAPELVILSGNGENWFTTGEGNHLQFASGVNFTADWLRANKGQSGTDAGFFYDTDGDGLKEIRVATLTLAAQDVSGALSDPYTYNVYIEDKNETPNAPDNGATKRAFLDETGFGSNPANPYSTVASFALSDPDGTTPQLRFSDGSTSQGWFYIDGNSVKLNPGTNHNFEWYKANGFVPSDSNNDGRIDAHIADVWVKAFDGNSWSNDELLQVYLSDVNEAPNAPDNGATKRAFLDETGFGSNPANPYSTVASFALSDPDGTTPQLRFSDGSTSQGWFYIDGNSVKLNPGTNHNFEWYQTNGFVPSDSNGDGRLDAHIADVWVQAFDGSAWSSGEMLKVYLSDVNERPNNLVVEASNLFSETLNGDTQHSLQLIARFTMADPDGTTPNLVILGGNENSWFQTAGHNHLQFSNGENFSADRLRANKGQMGVAADFTRDIDGDGLKEIRVASLTLAAQDGAGAQSDPFTYEVWIEDKNEAPYWTAPTNNVSLIENAGAYQYVLQLGAGDIDGPGSELRYRFSDRGQFSDPTLGVVTISPDGKFAMTHSGAVYVYGNQPLDFEAGQRNFNYSISVYDRAEGANTLRVDTTLSINLQDVNEQHTLTNRTFNVNETILYGPTNLVTTTTGETLNVRSLMLSDPENGRNLSYRFVGGSQTSGLWNIDASTGTIWMSEALNYEALSNKTVSLLVEAVDNGSNPQAPRSATLTLNIRDINEAPRITGYGNMFDPVEYTSQTNRNIVINASWTDEDTATGFAGPFFYQFQNYQWYSNGWKSLDAFYNSTGTTSSTNVTLVNSSYYIDHMKVDASVRDAGGVSSGWITIDIRYPGYAGPPVVFDLDGDGVELVSVRSSKIRFDMDADGVRDLTGWAGADDGLLAIDLNGNGIIDDGSEISFQPALDGAISDLEGLRAYDSNEDGLIDANDARFADFRVWQDLNQDGVSDPGELKTLVDAGIAAVNLTLTPTGQVWDPNAPNNVIYSYSEYYRTDGTVGTVGDAFFTYLKDGETTAIIGPHASAVGIDLDGNGISLNGASTSGVTFDQANTGGRVSSTWVGAGDAVLGLDIDGDGLISNGNELALGDDSFSLNPLRRLDQNGDGRIDASDEAFSNLILWQDINQDGVSQTDELQTLVQANVSALVLPNRATPFTLSFGESRAVDTFAVEFADGSGTTASNLLLAFDVPQIAAPIVFDLDADGASLVALADSTTLFDMNGDGIADKTGWIENGDAFLALDRNGNGTIDDINEISFVGDKAGAKTDLEGLVAFDTNGDGVLDGADERFVEFKLWVDSNANGKTDAGELLSLAEAGVGAISLLGEATGQALTSGQNIVYNTAKYTLTNGEEGKVLDVGLAFKALSALPETEFQTTTWEMKSKRYRLTASAGNVRVTPKKSRGVISADAGQLSGAAILEFKDRRVGMLSTILLDLDGDGLEARKSSKTRALFDMDGNGAADDTGWMAGGDGMLVIDRNGDGLITDESEISFLSEKEGAKNAWEGLSALDNTKDSKLSSADARFGDLKVWIDRNADGSSQADELKSLVDLGIKEISLRNTATNDTVKVGENLALSTATFTWSNGLTATIGNVALAFTPSADVSDGSADVAGQIDGAPSSAALAAANLAQAMSGFGADLTSGTLRKFDSDGMAAHDWLAASAY